MQMIELLLNPFAGSAGLNMVAIAVYLIAAALIITYIIEKE